MVGKLLGGCEHLNVRQQVWWERCVDCGVVRFFDEDGQRGHWSSCAHADDGVDMLDAIEITVKKSPWTIAQLLYGLIIKEYNPTT